MGTHKQKDVPWQDGVYPWSRKSSWSSVKKQRRYSPLFGSEENIGSSEKELLLKREGKETHCLHSSSTSQGRRLLPTETLHGRAGNGLSFEARQRFA